MNNKLMNSVLENSINQGLKTNLKNAIQSSGVSVSNKTGLWQYPEIIKNKLVANTITGINLLGKDIINISCVTNTDIMTYEISTCVDTYELDRPVWANANNKWNKKFTVQEVFNDLFSNILPKVKGVHAGDVISTDNDGKELIGWNHTLFGVTGVKTGLKPVSKYLRLYLTSQHEPLYICLSSYVEEITGGYNVTNSDTVDFIINNDEKKITAHINIITNEQLKSIGIVE